jgi:hypothetical protein
MFCWTCFSKDNRYSYWEPTMLLWSSCRLVRYVYLVRVENSCVEGREVKCFNDISWVHEPWLHFNISLEFFRFSIWFTPSLEYLVAHVQYLWNPILTSDKIWKESSWSIWQTGYNAVCLIMYPVRYFDRLTTYLIRIGCWKSSAHQIIYEGGTYTGAINWIRQCCDTATRVCCWRSWL